MVQIGVVTNPNARKNKLQKARAQKLKSILGSLGVVHETRALKDLPRIVDQFASQDVKYWVGDGGDGTLHWLLNGALDHFESELGHKAARAAIEAPLMVPTNGGTIDFLAKKVGIKGNAEVILESIVRHERKGRPFEVTELDTLLFRGELADGTPFSRIGFVAAVAGIGQRFFDKLYSYEDYGSLSIVKVAAKIVASFAITATPLSRLPGIPAELLTYGSEVFKRTRSRVTVDGKELPWNEYGELSVGAIDINLGGVMRFFPRAKAPGALHYQGGPISLKGAVLNLPRIMSGRNVNAEGFAEGNFQLLEVEALDGDTLAPVIDGEQYKNVARLSISAGPKVRVPVVKSLQNR